MPAHWRTTKTTPFDRMRAITVAPTWVRVVRSLRFDRHRSAARHVHDGAAFANADANPGVEQWVQSEGVVAT